MGENQARRRFTREFKREAVRQVVGEGRMQKQVAGELGLNSNVLSRWIKEFRSDPQQSFPGNGTLKLRDKELEQLRRENVRLRGEPSFLKNASAYSAKGPR